MCAGLRWLRDEQQLTSLHAAAAGETSTEVGTALTLALVESWEPLPQDLVGLTGLGAGSTESSDHAHVLKLVLST